MLIFVRASHIIAAQITGAIIRLHSPRFERSQKAKKDYSFFNHSHHHCLAYVSYRALVVIRLEPFYPQIAVQTFFLYIFSLNCAIFFFFETLSISGALKSIVFIHLPPRGSAQKAKYIWSLQGLFCLRTIF